MQKNAETNQLSARVRVSALTTAALALLSAGVADGQNKKPKKARAAAAGALTAGDVCGAMLLMVLPTTLHNAMMKSQATGGKLDIALEQAIVDNHDAAAADTYRALIADQRIKPLFDKMLTTANLDALAKIANGVNSAIGSQIGWTSPPHPGGGNVAKLLATLSPFTE